MSPDNQLDNTPRRTDPSPVSAPEIFMFPDNQPDNTPRRIDFSSIEDIDDLHEQILRRLNELKELQIQRKADKDRRVSRMRAKFAEVNEETDRVQARMKKYSKNSKPT